MNQYNPYAPPPPQPGMTPYYGGGMPTMGPYRELDALVMPKFGQLAPVCMKCGNPQCSAFPRKTFRFTPQWTIAICLISPLIGAIVAAIARKTAEFNVPLCMACNDAWRKANRNLGLSFLPGGGLFGLGVILAAADVGDVGGALIVLSLLVLLIAPLVVQFAHRRPRTLWTKKIDDRAAWLVGVHPYAMDATCGGPQPQMMPPGYANQMGQPYAPPHLMR